jgi:thiol-disulfide isomerase/thioredoxin
MFSRHTSALLALGLGLGGCAQTSALVSAKASNLPVATPLIEGQVAPDWSLSNRLGEVPERLQDLRGQVVILDFWATWCGPCRMTIPLLSSLAAEHAAEGLRIVGITWEDEDVVSRFRARVKMGYATGIDTEDARTSKVYGASALPTIVLIDRKGAVRHIVKGIPDRTQLREAVAELLAEAP